METVSALIFAPYSLVFLLDPKSGTIPQSMDGLLIASTESCVAIGCRAEVDGSTKVTIGDIDLVNPGYEPAFDGEIETPSKALEIQSVLGTKLLNALVQGERTRVAIWVNDSREPDEIIVGILVT